MWSPVNGLSMNWGVWSGPKDINEYDLIIIFVMKTIYRFFEFGPQSKGNEQGDDVTILAKGTRFLPEPAIASDLYH